MKTFILILLIFSIFIPLSGICQSHNLINNYSDRAGQEYKFLATLNSGTVPNSIDNGSYKPNYIINARFSYFYSENRNVGLDLSFTPYKGTGNKYDGYMNYESAYESVTDIIANSQFGTFDKDNIIDLYINLGAGIHVFYRSSYEDIYYSVNVSGYDSYHYNSYTRFYPVLQIGAGLIIKPVYNFGINLEADMQAYTFSLFIPHHADFPLKAGLSYYFME